MVRKHDTYHRWKTKWHYPYDNTTQDVSKYNFKISFIEIFQHDWRICDTVLLTGFPLKTISCLTIKIEFYDMIIFLPMSYVSNIRISNDYPNDKLLTLYRPDKYIYIYIYIYI